MVSQNLRYSMNPNIATQILVENQMNLDKFRMSSFSDINFERFHLSSRWQTPEGPEHCVPQ